LPKNSLPLAVRRKMQQANGLLIQPLDRIVQPFQGILACVSRKRIINAGGPPFFLQCGKNGFLVPGGLAEMLHYRIANPQLPAQPVPVGYGAKVWRIGWNLCGVLVRWPITADFQALSRQDKTACGKQTQVFGFAKNSVVRHRSRYFSRVFDEPLADQVANVTVTDTGRVKTVNFNGKVPPGTLGALSGVVRLQELIKS
jgi:hypothetical protein